MKAWRKQIFEVQTGRQARGLAGAVVCETRDLGIKWPQWHTLLLAGQVVVGMRVVCPQDLRKVFLRQARMAFWKKRSANHECEELKGGVWQEPIQVMLRKKTNEAWMDKHRNVTRKLVVEGGWVQRRWHDTGWSDEKKCRGCNKEEGTDKHRLSHCPCWNEVRNQFPGQLLRMGAKKNKTSKKDRKWQTGIASHSLSEGP